MDKTWKKKLTILLILCLWFTNFNIVFAQDNDDEGKLGSSFIFDIPKVGRASCEMRVSPELLTFFKEVKSEAVTDLNSIAVDQKNNRVAFRMRVEPDPEQEGDQVLFDILTIFKSVNKRDIAKILLAGQKFLGETLSNFIFQQTIFDNKGNKIKTIRLVTNPTDLDRSELSGTEDDSQLHLATVSGRLKKIRKVEYKGEKIPAADGLEKVRFEASEDSKLYIIEEDANGNKTQNTIEKGILFISCNFRNCPIEKADLEKIIACINSGECKVGENIIEGDL